MKIMKTILILTITALLLTACQTNSATTNNTVNKAVTNANQNTNQANKPETNTTATNANEAKAESNSTASTSASTPTAAYKAAHAACKNKDIKALKQLLAKDMLEFFEIIGEGKPNPLEAGLTELAESPRNPSDETRNEKIKGDTATLEFLDAKGEWKTMDFIKEDGAWKMTIAKMDKPEGKDKGKKDK